MSPADVVTRDDPPPDGRRARRERSRAAVIDAVFAAIDDGKVPPTVEDVAVRAGVSVSSVFRNFDGLPDMQRQAFDRFQERFSHLFDATVDAGTSRADRVRQLVRLRVELFSAAGPLMHIARQRALDYEPMAEAVARNRSRLADQARRFLAPELGNQSPAEAANIAALVDALTSPEAFEVMGAAHARSARQISRTWTSGVEALLDAWTTAAATEDER